MAYHLAHRGLVGRHGIRWLADAALAPFSIIAVHDWAVIPFFMMIWLAGLSAVPPEFREAAAIDGAGPVRIFGISTCRCCAYRRAGRRAVLDQRFPGLRVAIVLPNDPGGPANSTLVLGLLVLKYGFQYFRMGDAAAVSVVMFALIMTVTLAQLRFNRRA